MIEWNSVIQGDCLENMALLEEASVDLVLTDPPYGMAFKSGMAAKGFEKDAIANDDFEAWRTKFPRWVRAMKRVLKPGGTCIMFTSGGKNPGALAWAIIEAEEIFGWAELLIWDRCDLGMGFKYRPIWDGVLWTEKDGAEAKWFGGNAQGAIIRAPRIIPKAGEHPTPKPVSLLGGFIERHTEPGDRVLDPFCGEGPTLEAAHLLKRQWLGIELSDKWHARAKARMDRFSQQPEMF